MLILFDILTGSYDVLFYSILLATFVTMAFGSISFFTFKADASWRKGQAVLVQTDSEPTGHRPIIDQVLHQQVKWLKRTVSRQEGSEDDCFLFIPIHD
ncbi:hypothetical protein [Halobacillus salinus]|uniref:Uncharacterized protein n=1 Tax=Halobacillus salinus TaxID=192814 RepID=A0A4Z0H894_9BACI|nr:hypothetical protein [Halobacillus salinus]TGB05391.1 hypothetical protein E4663_10505 [Halobacillus salinus]